MKAVVWSERRRKAGPRHGEHRLTNRQIEMRLQKPFFFSRATTQGWRPRWLVANLFSHQDRVEETN